MPGHTMGQPTDTSETDHAGLLRDLGYGVFQVDARGVVTDFDDEAARITGFRKAEVIGKPCGTLDGGTLLTGITVWLAHRNDAPLPLAGILRARGRQAITVSGAARQLADNRGTIIGALVGLREDRPAAPISPTTTGETATPKIAGLVAISEPMQEVARRLQRAADGDITTLLLGESGTGKELAARAVHNLSDRRRAPFVAVNCAALPEAMLEAELFGHTHGAFTDAIADRPGLIQSADGGTLFLDEIGDMSVMTQVKLLRVLQEREVRRLGSDRCQSVDVRLVTATNRDLRQLLREGQLREDFYYRINVYEITMPPLRERLADIRPLVAWFVEQVGATKQKAVAEAALRRMLDYAWPGNVRELRNCVEHALVTAAGPTVELRDLPEQVRVAGSAHPGPTNHSPSPRDRTSMTTREVAERSRIVAELDRNDWNRTDTAGALGYSRVTLWKKMRKFSIDEGVFRRRG